MKKLVILLMFWATPAMADLLPLPAQPDGVPWPTAAWPQTPMDAGVDQATVEEAMAILFDPARNVDEKGLPGNRGVVVIHRGRLVAERYADGFSKDSRFLSQSMAKSFTQALVGLLVKDGLVDITRPAPVAHWQADSDPRRAITWDLLLRMESGLRFGENYFNPFDEALPMLFGQGSTDMAAFAAALPLEHGPGTHWSYASGSSNILAALVDQTLDVDRAGMAAFMRNRLFQPIGMRSAEPEFDLTGSFIGSSYIYATVRDFAKFGLLYLRGGVWDGVRLLPEGWVDYARTPTPNAPRGIYGAQWWLNAGGRFEGIPTDMFAATGFGGQYILIVPSKDVIVVRNGNSSYGQRAAILQQISRIIAAFPDP